MRSDPSNIPSHPNRTTGIVPLAMGAIIGGLVMMPFLIAARSPATPPMEAALPRAGKPEAAGRYIVSIADCNACHTPGFDRQGEAVPESERLIGTGVGFKGPWGISYPANLRLKATALTEDQWVTFARNHTGRPPMPWNALHAMTDADLRSVYRYIHSLGPSNNVVPDPVAPGGEATAPYILFEPVMPE